MRRMRKPPGGGPFVFRNSMFSAPLVRASLLVACAAAVAVDRGEAAAQPNSLLSAARALFMRREGPSATAQAGEPAWIRRENGVAISSDGRTAASVAEPGVPRRAGHERRQVSLEPGGEFEPTEDLDAHHTLADLHSEPSHAAAMGAAGAPHYFAADAGRDLPAVHASAAEAELERHVRGLDHRSQEGFPQHDLGHGRSMLLPRFRFEENNATQPLMWQQLRQGAICTDKETPLQDDQGGNAAALAMHNLQCGANEFMGQFRLTRGGTATQIKFKYQCCSLTPTIGQCTARNTNWIDDDGGSVMKLNDLEVLCSGGQALQRWQIGRDGEKFRFDFTCCSLPPDVGFGTCTDQKSTVEAARADARALVTHEAKCNIGNAMTRWKVSVLNDQIGVQYTCCPVGNMPHLGPRRTCTWVGDPHFWTFDGTRLDPTRDGAGVTYWIVKNQYVQIQSYYQGLCSGCAALTRGVAVAGKFLQGHKLIIKKDVNYLRNGANPSYRGSMGSEVWVDGVNVGMGKTIPGVMTVNMRNNGGWQQVEANLPLGITVQINLWSYYEDNTVTMNELPGGQDGQCGNNNGNAGDDSRDRLEYNTGLRVLPAENLFMTTANGNPVEVRGKTLDDCVGEARTKSLATCKAKLSGPNVLQEFIDMCVFDICFTTTPELAQTNAQAEKDFAKDLELMKPRGFLVQIAASKGDDARKACPAGKALSMIRSPVEQRAALEAADMAGKTATDLIWIGGKWKGGTWRWEDDAKVCGFTNWEDEQGNDSPQAPEKSYMCMSRVTGKWFQCKPTDALSILCEDPKRYGVLADVGPVQARTVCGSGKRIVMPKSADEQTKMADGIKAAGVLVYIGARYEVDHWEWEDGTEMCDFTFWDANQPDLSQKDTAQLFLCADSNTGRWRVCTGYTTTRPVACETQPQGKICALGKVNNKELSLSVNPGEKFAEFRNYCYYLAKGGEDCHDTCYKQTGGYCQARGLSEVATNSDTCKMVVQSFGNIGKTAPTRKVLSSAAGCTFIDAGSSTQVLVERLTSQPPTCGAKTSNAFQHRVCACGDTKDLHYPVAHAFVPGETARVSGEGYTKNQPFFVDLFADKRMDCAKASVVNPPENKRTYSSVLAGSAPGTGNAQSMLNSAQAWTASNNAAGEWLQMDLGSVLAVKGVVTQARAGNSQFVTKYSAGYSKDGQVWTYWADALDGAVDSNNRVVEFKEYVLARYIRLRVISWSAAVSMRAGVLVCDATATQVAKLLQEFETEATKQEPTWIRVLSCAGTTPGNRLDYTADKTKELANSAHQVKICTTGVPTDCIVSKYDSFPIMMLRKGWTISHNNGASCDTGCVANTWTGARTSHMWSTCGTFTDGGLTGAVLFYHACNNGQGVHISAASGGLCGWTSGGGGNLEVFIDSPTTPAAGATTPVMQLKADPAKMTTGWCTLVAGNWNCNDVLLWPFGSETSKWTVDVAAGTAPGGKAMWQVSINGLRQPALDTPREGTTTIGDIRGIGAPNVKTVLIPQQLSDVTSPVALNTENGCMQHPFTAEDKILSMSFMMNMKSADGWRCIRCEVADITTGTNLQIKDGRLTFDADGNVPRSQSFLYKFSVNVDYEITVAFIAADSVVELYVQQQRVETLRYDRATTVKLKPAYLGCWHDQRKFVGLVSEFTVKVGLIPTYRPLSEACDSYVCPVGYASKADLTKVFCAKTVCTLTDRDTCCDKVAKCDTFTCPPATMFKSNPSSILCLGATCKGTPWQTCCDEVGRCSTLSCPAGYVQVPQAAAIWCGGTPCNVATDLDRCCQPTALCGTMTCPAGFAPKKVAANQVLRCGGRTCVDADRSTCCAEMGKCTSYACPNDYSLRGNAAEILCADLACEATPFTKCCVPKGKCNSYVCPAGTAQKDDAATIACGTGDCSAKEDAARCCTEPGHCNSHLCPAGFGLKPGAEKLLCKGLFCASPVDDSTCCSGAGRCSSMACPVNYLPKAKAADILCSDPTCNKTDYKLCCAETGRCPTYPCPDGYVSRDNAANLYCTGLFCQDSDRDRCCLPRAACTQLTCPVNFRHKPNFWTLKCKGWFCTPDDFDTCCSNVGMCSSYSCPPGYQPRSNASKIPCADQACQNTAVETCCDKEGKCTTYQCPQGYVHRFSAPSLFCNGFKCTATDRDTCCDVNAMCNTYICPAGRLLHRNAANISCASRKCSQWDTGTCCVLEGQCSAFKCPFGFLPKPDAEKIPCDDKECLATPYTKCCAQSGKCSSYGCPSGYVAREASVNDACLGWECNLQDRDNCCDMVDNCGGYQCSLGQVIRPNSTGIPCKGKVCGSVDRNACCTDAGRCSAFQCPSKWLPRPDAQTIFCTDRDCKSTSYDLCCVQEGRCSSMQCPPGWVSRANSSGIFCAGIKCVQTDTTTCCNPVGSCNSDACPSFMVLRKDFTTQFCKGKTCNINDDSASCCTNRGMCLSFDCPPGYQLRHNASSTPCTDQACANTAFSLCCAEMGTCNTYKCPKGFLPRPAANATFCAGRNCTIVDKDRCCDPVDTCGGFTKCPPGTTLRSNPSSFECAGLRCDDGDAGTCCAAEGMCDSYFCPPGYQLRGNSSKIFCTGTNCNNTDYRICCAEEGRCPTYTCPPNYVHGQNISRVYCTGFRCTDVDRDLCCDPAASCVGDICAVPRVQKSNSSILFCKNQTCTKDDEKTCCTIPGRCTSYQCPKDYLHRANADDLMCQDLQCKLSDFKTCCVEQNHCESYKCPAGYDLRVQVTRIYCSGYLCTEKDRDTCCTPVAMCNTFVCPAGMILVNGSTQIKCKNRTCTDADLGTCCVLEGTCNRFSCPPGWDVKPNATKLRCKDDKCANTDYHTCCDERATCDSFICPGGMVARPNGMFTYCAGQTCRKDRDNATCCDKQANCGSFTCPLPWKAKAKAQEISCRGSTCRARDDLRVCCATQASCGSYACPMGYRHKADAHKILCPERNCSKATYLLCCAKEGTCPTYMCPEGLVLREDAASRVCTGSATQCTNDDEDKCCKPAALCSSMACPTGFKIRHLAPNMFCEGAICSQAADLHTCCAEQGKCSSYPCPSRSLPRFDAASIVCPNRNCTGLDPTACCAQEGTCDTFLCPSDYIRKPKASNLTCQSSSSGDARPRCTDADIGSCCDAKQLCSDWTCPTGMAFKSEYRELVCAGTECGSMDAKTCCEAKATCATLMCPAGTSSKGAGALCQQQKCTDADVGICCRQRCETFACPAGYTNKTDKVAALCVGPQCDKEVDKTSCCDILALCSTLKCPDGTINRGPASSCKGKACGDSDISVCCAASCVNFKCPALFVNKTNREALTCATNTCGTGDTANCCNARATCDSYTCVAGTVNKGSAQTCKGASCTFEDFDTCCAAPCSTFTCPKGFAYKQDYTARACKNSTCGIWDTDKCCDGSAPCTTMDCPKGSANRGNAFSCAAQTCLGEDEKRCCVALCSTYTCPMPFISVPNASTVRCAGRKCRDEDKDSCCETRALCNTMQCPEHMVLASASLYCAGARCNETDVWKCCTAPKVVTQVVQATAAPTTVTTSTTTQAPTTTTAATTAKAAVKATGVTNAPTTAVVTTNTTTTKTTTTTTPATTASAVRREIPKGDSTASTIISVICLVLLGVALLVLVGVALTR